MGTEPKDNTAKRVFLSFGPGDRVAANKILKTLRQAPGIEVSTLDSMDLGKNWRETVKDKLSKCSVVYVLISAKSLESPNVLFELGAAWAKEIPIVPIVTDKTVSAKLPSALRHYQFVDADDLTKPATGSAAIQHMADIVSSPAKRKISESVVGHLLGSAGNLL